MKEAIYTIPINDAYDIKCGCPLCRLEKQLDDESSEYVMGAAMMEPDVRIETNKTGFCPRHFEKMLGMKNRLSLALMMQSYLAELLEKGVVSNTTFMTKHRYADITKKISEASNRCFICERVAEKLNLYVRNIIYMWQSEQEFRTKTREQEYFCPKHLAMLLECGKKELSRSNYSAFCNDHFGGTIKKLEFLSEEVTKFCNSYNYLFRDIPLGDAKYAIEHTVEFLNGGIVTDEDSDS